MNDKVKLAVITAYADANESPLKEQGKSDMELRNLNFKADEFVSRDEAVEILTTAIESGYNEFDASLVSKFPPEATFQIAREGSVCLYVNGNGAKLPTAKAVKAVKADERNKEGDVVRFWWD